MNVTKIVKRVFLNMSGLCFREPMPESVLEDPIIFFWVCGVKEMAGAWNFSLNKPETRFLEWALMEYDCVVTERECL